MKFVPGKIDSRRFREVLGSFATGVAIVTTLDAAARPVGLTVNSFNSVSLEPPLILWSISLASPSRSAFTEHGAFAVNILSHRQLELCRRFSRAVPEKFSGVNHRPGLRGVPIIPGTLASLECEVERSIVAGDHEIFIGQVMRFDSAGDVPLIYHRNRFGTLDHASS